MLFFTSTFAVFFAAVWGLHWASARWPRVNVGLLALASWVFYAWWDWRFLGLLLGSTAVDYLCAQRIAVRDAEQGRRWLKLSLGFNLGVLGLFKYFDFFSSSAAALLGSLGFSADAFTLDVVLPVGISFYTFQTLGYTVDVYRRRIPATRDPLAFAAYVAFFPQLVAGPIERAERLLEPLAARKRFALSQQVDGAARFALGLFEKIVVADSCGRLADRMFELPGAEQGALEVAIGTVAFAFQIWGDFAGYTDMAVGAAKMLGVELTENFYAPYLSRSPREFWRRWHVSLSTWLRDYLYVPLGGNRRGGVRTQINLALTMLLGGLWHGAAWTFVIWGAWHGVWLAVHRAWVRLREGAGFDPEAAAAPVRALYGLAAGVVTFVLVCVGWVFFRAPDFATAAQMFSPELAVGRPDHAWASLAYLGHYLWPAMVIQGLVRFVPELRQGGRWRSVLILLALWGLVFWLLHGDYVSERQFIYFQF